MSVVYNGTSIDKIVYNGVEIFGSGKPELLWSNSNQQDWGEGQTVSCNLSSVNFTKDLVYFIATIESSDRTKQQCICLNGKTSATICGLLQVSGGGWHNRTITFTSTGWTISTYSNWGGPRVIKLYRIKNALA